MVHCTQAGAHGAESELTGRSWKVLAGSSDPQPGHGPSHRDGASPTPNVLPFAAQAGGKQQVPPSGLAKALGQWHIACTPCAPLQTQPLAQGCSSSGGRQGDLVGEQNRNHTPAGRKASGKEKNSKDWRHYPRGCERMKVTSTGMPVGSHAKCKSHFLE